MAEMGRPPKSNASKQLAASRNAKPVDSVDLVEMSNPEIPPKVLQSKAVEMWHEFIVPLAKARIFLESDRIAATIIAQSLASMFSGDDESEKRLNAKNLLDLCTAAGLTRRSRDMLNMRGTTEPPASRQR